MWRDPNGDSRSKLLLTKPEMVIAIVLRGDTEPNGERKTRPRFTQITEMSDGCSGKPQFDS